ncbi:unnamed protein product [Clonostachys rhizophaga]|uniref:T6SS Phospholipase effector Tle1-like catalytic domain-containing protein n=1 Tax=Clonostachys rhizophaga TaxID=160324 RepID=A0A9N9VT17_9HYPO|nr:unnamed protein product [Clonostachys rhizophaga]
MAENTRKVASHKRIILCADGTWQASDIGSKSLPSNVAKLARAISNNGLDDQGNLVKQIVSYHSGLGSGDLPFQKLLYGTFGWGLDVDVCQIYDFISNNYEAGDELFFFGWSRGAFTVRSVAALVCEIGVLSAVNMSRFAEMWEAYRANTGGQPFRESKWYLENKDELALTNVKVKVVGVWDTVGALGIPEWPVVKWARKIGLRINSQYAFHDTKLSTNVEYAFQALALDERRLTFPPTLWHRTNDGPIKDLQQCWFPGIHGDVAGMETGSPASAGAEMGYNSFAWMVDNLAGMLTFEDDSINVIIEDHTNAMGKIVIPDGWGCGPIASNFSGLQGGLWWLLGRQVRTPGSYPKDPGDQTNGETNEYFHPTVRIRRQKLEYYPAALKKYAAQRREFGDGWEWVKKGLEPVPEYVMRPGKEISLAYEEGGVVNYRVGESLARLLCPKSILSELDSGNRS